MTQLVKDRLSGLVTVVERIIEVVVPATSYQVSIAGGTADDVAKQKAAIRPNGSLSAGGGGSRSGVGNAYSYNGTVWVENAYNQSISPPGWTVL